MIIEIALGIVLAVVILAVGLAMLPHVIHGMFKVHLFLLKAVLYLFSSDREKGGWGEGNRE